MASNELVISNVRQMKGLINSKGLKERIKDVLGKEASTFLASVLDLYSGDQNLVECDANLVMQEAMKAAALHLPVSKQLGFCYVVPYRDKGVPRPQFQLGYKGMIQLAQRSGQYKYINADIVYEGETVKYDRVTGGISIEGEPTSDNPIGYFAYFQLLNGFEKATYWSKEKVIEHAKRYSKAYNYKGAPWQTQFDAMALKTVLRHIITKYGIMSIEMANIYAKDIEADIEREALEQGNGDPIILPQNDVVQEQKEEPKTEEVQTPSEQDEEPEF